MSAKGDQPTTKRPGKTGNLSLKLKESGTERELADDRLDEALRQTFPASDALSIVQSARCR